MRPILIGLLAALLAAGAQSGEGERQLKAAMNAELVNGDLKAAIKHYGEIAAKYRNDRAVAAMALVRMAEAYQKMGDAEARKIFERVVREYADQKEAVALARGRLGGGTGARGLSNRLLWSGPKVDDDGTVSSDGRYLSTVDWETGDLAVHDFATRTDRKITNKGSWNDSGDFALESSISRDGKLVAYTWWNNKTERAEMRIANVAGDARPTTLYDRADVRWLAPYDWSPDGKSVAAEINRQGGRNEMVLVAVPEGSIRVLKVIGRRGSGKMFFSPDGKWLAYDSASSDANPQHDIFVVSADGSREFRAVAHPSQDAVIGWSRDGRWVLFTSDRTGSADLWGLRFVNGEPQGAPERLKADFGWAVPLGTSAAGALYYAAGRAPRVSRIQIGAIDLSTGKFLSGPTDLPQQVGEFSLSPLWSPDGKYLAYTSGILRPVVAGQNRVVRIRSMETQQVRELRLDMPGFALSTWSPDGRSLLAAGGTLEGRIGIYEINVETGKRDPLLIASSGAVVDMPQLSHDGRKLYYRSRPGSAREYIFIERDRETGREREIIRRPFLGYIHLSPDGRYIATSGIDVATNSAVALAIPVDGGTPKELMRIPRDVPPEEAAKPNKGSGLGVWPWAPDGRSVLVRKRYLGASYGTTPAAGESNPSAVFSESSPKTEMWQVWLDGTPPRKLDWTMDNNVFGYRMHPDGKQAAFEITDYEGRPNSGVWVLENFLPER